MPKFYRLLKNKFLTAAAVLIFCFPSYLSAQKNIEGVLRIKVGEELSSRLEANRSTRNVSGEIATGVESIDQINRQFRVRHLERVFPHAGKHEARHRKHGLHLWYEVRMDKTIPVADVLQSYQSSKHILRAEAVLRKEIIGSADRNFGPRIIREPRRIADALPNAPDDPLLSSQWHYHNTGQTGGTAGADISLLDAWKIETGRPEVVIAVMDGGIQTDHPDLAPNMWTNPGEVAANNVDDDNNGYVDDVHGYSFVSADGDIAPHEHGTHVAGTLAAVNNNGAGVAGVAGGSGIGDGVRLMSCAVFHSDSVPDGFAAAYVYSADNGAVISQNSWGYTQPGVFEQVVLDAIDYFIAEAGRNELGQQTGPMNGGIVIFSTGNFNQEGNYYPAFYAPVLSVTATNHKDLRAHYANYGTWVDIAAPGGETDNSTAQGVVSTLPGGQYGSFMGTSMACPHVSGVAALIVSKFGKEGFHPEALRSRLLLSVDDIGALNPQYSEKLGSGRLNAAFALREGDQTAPDAITDLSVSGTAVGEITLAWTSPVDEGDFVAAYDLRYSTAPINAENFSAATKVENLPTPASPGTPESFTVTNLPGGALLYFAIRSLDFEGNASALSNVVSQTSAFTPALIVTPSEITEHLKTAQKSTRTFVIRNDGKGLLTFSIEPATGNHVFATMQPLEGEVPAGKNQTITVNFDASRKLSGTYLQDVVINSNDPQRKTARITLIMKVTNNGSPIASVTPDALDFKSVQVGHVLRRTVRVSNDGSKPLSIREIKSDKEFFSDFKTPHVVNPFDSVDIPITFAPKKTGQRSGAITIVTNGPRHGRLTVSVAGEGLRHAPIVVSSNSFHETLERGSIITRTMTLRNNGSQSRAYRLEVTNNRLRTSTAPSPGARTSPATALATEDTTHLRSARRLAKHQATFAAQPDNARSLATPLLNGKVSETGNRSGRTTSDQTLAFKREVRKYTTGFEEFITGPINEQQRWFTTQGWTIAEENPRTGSKHFRGKSAAIGNGESYALSPYLFEYEEFYYPQYSTVSMRLNLDNAKGSTWEVVPQDPWSYVATRVRFNADGTIEALVIDNQYVTRWEKVPATVPRGYFDLAVEYNNAGTDTSGFPTYYLFINNIHVFSGTGLGSGIGQVAIVSQMQSSGPVLDMDDLQLTGGEHIPSFLVPAPASGTILPGQEVNVNLKFDASIIKYGTYDSDLVIHLDDIDSLMIPVSLTVPGEPSFLRDVNSVYMEVEKHETGWQNMSFRNTGGAPVDLRFEHNIPGLTLDPPAATIGIREEEVVRLTFDGAPGVYEDDILIHTNISSEPQRLPVHITKFDSGAVFYAPAELKLQATAGQVSTRTLQVRNDGINTVSFITTIQNFDSVITIDPARSILTDQPLNLTITVDATRLSPGTYTGRIRFTTNDAARRSVYTTVTLNVSPGTSEGKIAREVWKEIPGKAISAIPLDRAPTSTELLTSFMSPSNVGDNYGARLRGWVVPPVTGTYTFWIASNDNSELWLSTDNKERNKRRVAHVTGYTNPLQWNKFANQMSGKVHLVANRKYYIEALHKEATGSDHLAVGWQLPGGTQERPIPGLRLIPYGARVNNIPPAISILSPADGEIISAPAIVPIHAQAVDQDGTVVKVEFFSGRNKLSTDISAPYMYNWTKVPAGEHNIMVKATDNLGAVDSASVIITVTSDHSPCEDAGRIVREQWNGIPGTLISSIPSNTSPALKEFLTIFESPSNTADNYGSRIRGFLCVPESGNYKFWIASNDKSELWLSTDSDPSNKVKIAHVSGYTAEREWTKYATQQSTSIYLESGHSYYIEALHKEGVGSDHLSVGWQLPDGTLERPIAGSRLVPFDLPGGAPVVTISNPRNGDSFTVPASIQISADATDDVTVQKVAFYQGGQKIGEDTTAPYKFTWTGAASGVYSITAIATDDEGISTTSSPVQITVEAMCSASGSITRELWTGISGNEVSLIPINAEAQRIESLAIFEGPVNAGINYGAKISGYICPPVTGEYYFWISSNDHSELWLSSDETEANKLMIASLTRATDPRQWDKFRSQKSVAITLAAGKTYYIEALHKQGIGTDHIAVGWQLPDGRLERPISGSHLSPAKAPAAATAAQNILVSEDHGVAVEVYPNPVDGERLSIRIDNLAALQNAGGEITIRQLTGAPVYNEKITCEGSCLLELDVDKYFTPGIYILQVKTGNKTFTEKLIVP